MPLALYLLVTYIIHRVRGQSLNLPACADSCLQSSETAQGSCSNVDIGCLCSNVQYVDVFACCLSKTCGTADQQVAQAFYKALCAGVNVIIPNFLGCGNSSTTKPLNAAVTTVQVAGLEEAVVIPTTAAVASFNGHSLLTGSCSIPHPVIATLDDGGLLEYPRLGCSNEEPKCCPFNVHVGGPLSVCPADYTTTSGACCPSGWSIYTSDLAGQTPCFTTTPLSLHVSTTLDINERDNINPTAFGPKERSAPTDSPRSLSLRQNIAPVKIISTHLFTLRYDLMPRNTGVSTGAKVGIAVGAGIGGTLLLFLLALLISRARRRGHERKVAEASSAIVSSGIVSPRTAGSTYPASNYSRAQTAVSDRSGPWTSADRARSPMASQPSVELPSQPSSAMIQQSKSPPLPALPVVKSPAPQELSAAPMSPTDSTPPVFLGPKEERAATPSAEFETHQFFSPTGGKFR